MQDLASNHNSTVAATIQTGQKGVPEETKKQRDRDFHSALFAWSRDIGMVNFVLVSTCHTQPNVSTKGQKTANNLRL